MALRDQILERAGGDGFYSFDQWNWFYEVVTGSPAPAPEDVGLMRNEAGEVILQGSARYNFATWKAAAFPKGFPGETSDTGKPQEPARAGVFDQLLALFKKLVYFLVSGRWV